MSSNDPRPGRYRHFKGGEYEVIGVALHSETNERLVRAAGLSILESRPEPMEEPESEPGRGPETASFHWILAQKG